MKRAKVKRNEVGTEKEQTVPKYQRPRNDSSTSLLSLLSTPSYASIDEDDDRLYTSWFMPRSITKRGHVRIQTSSFGKKYSLLLFMGWIQVMKGSIIFENANTLQSQHFLYRFWFLERIAYRAFLFVEKFDAIKRDECRLSITSNWNCNNNECVKRLQWNEINRCGLKVEFKLATVNLNIIIIQHEIVNDKKFCKHI